MATVFLMRPEPRAPQSNVPPGANQPTGAGRQPAQSAAVAADAPHPAAEAAPARSEILAERRVWVRVVVDGVKTVERELGAGEHVGLPAGANALIRAGNAGAVRVTVNGEDRGLLGAEGQVVTRTVRIPAAPAR
jgi:hypothetical protein